MTTIHYYLAGPVTQPDWRYNSDIGARGDDSHDWTRTNLRLSNGYEFYDSEEGMAEKICGLDKYPTLDDGVHGPARMIRTGPWVIGCDHGCFHGRDSHGIIWDSWDSEFDSRYRQSVMRLSVEAISRSDVLVAWIDSVERVGTISEIGVAHGMGIPVALFAKPNFIEHGWFLVEMVQSVTVTKKPPSLVAAMEAALVVCGLKVT